MPHASLSGCLDSADSSWWGWWGSRFSAELIEAAAKITMLLMLLLIAQGWTILRVRAHTGSVFFVPALAAVSPPGVGAVR